jgi:hypothetical protein
MLLRHNIEGWHCLFVDVVYSLCHYSTFSVHIHYQYIYTTLAAHSHTIMSSTMREAAGAARLRVLCCPKEGCSRHCIAASIWELDPLHSWLIHLTCQECGTTWAACRTCEKARAPITNHKRLMRHRENYHAQVNDSSNVCIDIDDVGTVPLDVEGREDNAHTFNEYQTMLDTPVDEADISIHSQDTELPDMLATSYIPPVGGSDDEFDCEPHELSIDSAQEGMENPPVELCTGVIDDALFANLRDAESKKSFSLEHFRGSGRAYLVGYAQFHLLELPRERYGSKRDCIRVTVCVSHI